MTDQTLEIIALDFIRGAKRILRDSIAIRLSRVDDDDLLRFYAEHGDAADGVLLSELKHRGLV